MEVDQEKEDGAATQATNEEKNASLLLGLAMGDGGGSRSLPGAGRPCVSSSHQSAGGSATSPQPEVKDVTAAGTIAKGSADPASEICPDWASEMSFCSEMLDGNQVSYILRNPAKMRNYALASDETTEQFCIYDRHPPATALEPMSGVMYFVRITEGLQDKAISLKSVATGPSNFVWKMAWGRKTHLKSSGVLYKSYRCRYLYRPKNSPPPFRMQIYTLEEHDVETAKGDVPLNGLALIHILSVQDAPPRHWPSVRGAKRSAASKDGEEEEECAPLAAGARSGSRSVVVPATPVHAHGSRASPRGEDAAAPPLKTSKVATKLESLYSPAGSSSSSSRSACPGTGSGGQQHGGACHGEDREAAACTPASADPHHGAGQGGGSMGKSYGAGAPPLSLHKGHVVVASLLPCSSSSSSWSSSTHPKTHRMRIACDPLDSLGGGVCEGNVARATLLGTVLAHEVAAKSQPEIAKRLGEEYGGMAPCILAGLVTGTPWGIAGGGSRGAEGGSHVPDLTALGWARLMSSCEQQKQGRAKVGARGGR